MDIVFLLARLALAAVFATAAIGKFMDLSGSAEAMGNFGIPARFTRLAGTSLPFLEILVAMLLIPVSTAFWAAILGAILLLGFIGGIANLLRKGEAPDCHCFGAIHSAPVGKGTLARNGVFLALAVVVLAGGTSPGASLFGWLSDASGVEIGLVIAAVVFTLAIAGLGWMVFHLLGQNGRLLIRLDEIEELVKARPAIAPTPAQIAARKAAPDFVGTGLIGERVTLTSLCASAKPLLLVFSDPGCGPCNALMPEVAAWQNDLADRATVAVVTRGSIDDARKKYRDLGISNVLIEADRAISIAYDAPGTPSAVLVDESARIASDVAAGADNIRKLVGRVTSGELPGVAAPPPPPAAPARPAAPAIGTPAPVLALSGPGGAKVGKDELSGTAHALIFWNPGCGFCQRMTADLHEWVSEFGDSRLPLVLVTSGTEAQSEGYTFASHIGFDQSFATGRQFGASGTPSAILIAADGTIGSSLVVGGPAIMDMLRSNSQAPVLS